MGAWKVEGGSHPHMQVALGRTGRRGHADPRGSEWAGRDMSGLHLLPSSPHHFARIWSHLPSIP